MRNNNNKVVIQGILAQKENIRPNNYDFNSYKCPKGIFRNVRL